MILSAKLANYGIRPENFHKIRLRYRVYDTALLLESTTDSMGKIRQNFKQSKSRANKPK